MSEENLRRVAKLSYCLIGSDSSVYTGEDLEGKPHPRAFGTFPRVISLLVRQEHLFSLGEAISRMTYRTAQRFGLEGRGEIKVGNYADLVVFDPESIEDRATYEYPTRLPEGILCTIVNGVIAFEKGQFLSSAGRILKR